MHVSNTTCLKFTGRNRHAIDGIPVGVRSIHASKFATIREGKRNGRLGHGIGLRIQIRRRQRNAIHLFTGDLVSVAIHGIRCAIGIIIDVNIGVLIRAENLREFLVQIRILIARKLGRHVFCIHTMNILISQNLLIRIHYPMG